MGQSREKKGKQRVKEDSKVTHLPQSLEDRKEEESKARKKNGGFSFMKGGGGAGNKTSLKGGNRERQTAGRCSVSKGERGRF